MLFGKGSEQHPAKVPACHLTRHNLYRCLPGIHPGYSPGSLVGFPVLAHAAFFSSPVSLLALSAPAAPAFTRR